MAKYTRKPLSVGVVYRHDGKISPVVIICDGEKFQIDKIIDQKIHAPLSVGSISPIEFTVLVSGEEKKIYFEKDTGKWFSVKEAKENEGPSYFAQ